jgi:taurine transport system substrate-binding protein
MKLKTALKGAVAGLTLVSGSAAFAGGHGELNVAYFLEWPMPF